MRITVVGGKRAIPSPRAFAINGRMIMNPTDVQYEEINAARAAEGLLPYLEKVEDPPACEPGYQAVPVGWEQADGTWRRTYQVVPVPGPEPRVFSKFALEGKLFEEGLMDQVDAIIDAQVITNSHGQTMPLRRRYETALVFREDHPDFARVFAAIKQALGVTDEKAEEILAASVEE